jgi:hypothetical protein
MEDLRRCYSDSFKCSECDKLTQECFFPEYKQDEVCHACFLNTIVSYKQFLKTNKPTVNSFEVFTGWQRSSTFEKEWFQRRLNNLCINIR